MTAVLPALPAIPVRFLRHPGGAPPAGEWKASLRRISLALLAVVGLGTLVLTCWSVAVGDTKLPVDFSVGCG